MTPGHLSTTIPVSTPRSRDPQARSSRADAVGATGVTAFRSAQFSIAISRSMGTVVLTVHGDLDGPAAVRLGGLLADIIDGQGNLGVVVDLHDTSASAAGRASMFAATADLASKRGASLSLRNPPDVLYQALVLMGLGRLVRTTRHDGRRPSPSAPFGRIAAPGVRACHPAGTPRERESVSMDVQRVAKEGNDGTVVLELAHDGVDGRGQLDPGRQSGSAAPARR